MEWGFMLEHKKDAGQYIDPRLKSVCEGFYPH